MARRKTPFIFAIILGIFSLLFFAFDAHAESTTETPRQLCADARRDGSYTILEDTQDKCTYVLPGVIKHEHFYQGNQLCYRSTGYDVMTGELRGDDVSTECFDRVYPGQAEEVTKPVPTQEIVKQPSPKPTAAFEKNEAQEKPEAKVMIFGTDVKPGDTVTAEGKSKIVIFMPDGAKIDLKEGAKMKFYTEDEIEAQRGIFRFLINKLTGGKIKRIRAGAMLGSIRGTEFLVEVGDNGNTNLKVIDGMVEVSSIEGKGTVQVAAGQETKTAKGGLPTKPKTFDPKTLDQWWEGLPTEAPSDGSDFWVGLIALGVLGGGVYWVFRKIINALRGKEKYDTAKVGDMSLKDKTSSVTPNRSFILRRGNTILFILMIVLGLFVGIANSEGAKVAAFLALNIFYLVIPAQMILSIIRIFKKYHRFRSFIWLLIVPVIAFLLVMSFLPAS